MVNDQEPRYRLVNSNGNVVGSLFQNADGNVEIQDETGTGSVFGPDGIVTPAIDAESASVDDADTDRLVENDAPEVKAWTRQGDSPDERLDSAISDANQEEIIRLENADYDDERTGDDAIDKSLIFRGTAARLGGTRFNGNIDFDGGVSIHHCRIDSTVTINRSLTRVSNCLVTGDIVVDDDIFVGSNITGEGSITFGSGTENGAIGAKDGRLSITDNGNNEVLSG